ncbi:MAG: hypothetical protein KA120_09670, partial [Candidatus Goldbacteria bacterium]|nr:hypothetical protein [Candidatus Goldiibacteriota bacterium]
PCLSLRHRKLKSLHLLSYHATYIKEKYKSPSFPLFLRGIINYFPLFEKEGLGEILFFQIPLIPPFLKGKKKKTNPPLSPFF